MNNEDTGTGMSSIINQFWKKRRSKLIHDYSLVGYLLSPNPTIMEHAVNNKDQIHDDAAERLITKLLLNPARGQSSLTPSWKSKEISPAGVVSLPRRIFGSLPLMNPPRRIDGTTSILITKQRSWASSPALCS